VGVKGLGLGEDRPDDEVEPLNEVGEMRWKKDQVVGWQA
jgi:hypothetical protein